MRTGVFVVAVRSKANATPSFKRSITAPNLEVAMEPMRRKLIWIKEQHFWGWGCSECAWMFRPLGPLVGKSIDDMKMHYKQQCDKEFAAHVCAVHPRRLRHET